MAIFAVHWHLLGLSKQTTRCLTCASGSQPAPTALTCAYGCGSNFYFLETTPIAMEKARKKIAEFEKKSKIIRSADEV
jgi:hypothetical protein